MGKALPSGGRIICASVHYPLNVGKPALVSRFQIVERSYSRNFFFGPIFLIWRGRQNLDQKYLAGDFVRISVGQSLRNCYRGLEVIHSHKAASEVSYTRKLVTG